MFWTVAMLIVAILSLVVNILQFLENKKLKKDINRVNMKAGAHSKQNQQSHTGIGSNIIAGNDVHLGK